MSVPVGVKAPPQLMNSQAGRQAQRTNSSLRLGFFRFISIPPSFHNTPKMDITISFLFKNYFEFAFGVFLVVHDLMF